MTSSRGRWAAGLASAGVAWGIVFLAGALTLPAYRTEPGHLTSPLVAAGDTRGIALAALPAVYAAAVWWLIHRRCATGARGAREAARALIVVLFAFCMLTGFTIGLFLLPMAVLLALSATLARPT